MDLSHQIAELERSRPDPAVDPDGFRRVNEQIARLIDGARTYRFATARRVV